jgi:hypothetical protein
VLPTSQRAPHDAYSDNTERSLGGRASPAITRRYAGPSAGAPKLNAPRVAESADRSRGRKTWVGFEGSQACRLRSWRQVFSKHLHRDGSLPQCYQQSQRPHGQPYRAIPPRPTPDPIVIQPRLALGCLKGLFNDPVGPRLRDMGFPIQPCVTSPTGILQKAPDLAMLDPQSLITTVILRGEALQGL